ncbi:hypothetical protein HYH03_002882 [Edaphochlamys debaryana]|uniref:Uncharacterized protein n=1 Tax=Edaphochlamys debaryana TaxID=47281 RepID=A0A835YCQ6_9CHLO|nr:hypothetical protein HYH03_002882 [Edaphochlamys debaryana]|eukprot:KAG2499304.1 hypothetical protein HYH03_002882 [Edaphochlamys debaryana]
MMHRLCRALNHVFCYVRILRREIREAEARIIAAEAATRAAEAATRAAEAAARAAKAATTAMTAAIRRAEAVKLRQQVHRELLQGPGGPTSSSAAPARTAPPASSEKASDPHSVAVGPLLRILRAAAPAEQWPGINIKTDRSAATASAAASDETTPADHAAANTDAAGSLASAQAAQATDLAAAGSVFVETSQGDEGEPPSEAPGELAPLAEGASMPGRQYGRQDPAADPPDGEHSPTASRPAAA